MPEDFLKYIQIDLTISNFGYDPRTLTRGSQRKVFVLCAICDKSREKRFSDAIKQKYVLVVPHQLTLLNKKVKLVHICRQNI